MGIATRLREFMFAHAKEREYAGRGLSDHLEVTHGEGTPMKNGDSATNRRIEEPRTGDLVDEMGHFDPDRAVVMAPRTNLVLTRHRKSIDDKPVLGLPVVAERQRAA